MMVIKHSLMVSQPKKEDFYWSYFVKPVKVLFLGGLVSRHDRHEFIFVTRP